MGTTTRTREPINKLEGTNRVLVIAPHGVKQDDTNTNKLALKLQKKLGCYAVINQGYRRPEQGKDAVPNKNIANLNSLEQVREHLNVEFLKPIVDYKNDIISKEYGSPVVVLIHGMANKNMDTYYGPDIQAVVGAGVGINLIDRHSMSMESVEQFVKLLGEDKDFPLKVVQSDKTLPGTDDDDDIKKKYGGWSKDNLNQLFSPLSPEYNKDDNVQSVQIELKEQGIRDTDENIKKTANTLAVSLATLLGIELVKKTKEVVVKGENEVDEKLVEETTVEITNIFCKHFGNGVVAAGKLLFEKFFNNDMNAARKLKPVLNKSFKKLKETIRKGERYKEAPSESWLYRAVQLYVEHQDIKEIFGEEVFVKYDSLLISHQVELLPVRNVDNTNSTNNKDTKLQLINETVENKYSVAELKARRLELIPKIDKSLGKKYSLPQIINRDEMLLDDANVHLYDKDVLIKLDEKTTLEVKEKTESKITRLEKKILGYEKELKEKNKQLERQQLLLEKCGTIIKRLKPIEDSKPGDKVKVKGGNEVDGNK